MYATAPDSLTPNAGLESLTAACACIVPAADGDQPDHYGGDGQGSVREHWEAPAETRPALVGIHLDDEDRQAWRHVFEGTTSGTGVWSDVGGGLGAILGRRGSGVANDAHMPVFFHHLFGRKVWGFSRDEVEEWQERQGVCEPELLAMPRACVLSAGDFLYAPSGWYHSTCHLDATSLTLIQWAEEEEQQAQRRPAGSSAAADRSLEARVDLLPGLRVVLALVLAEVHAQLRRACLAAMLMPV